MAKTNIFNEKTVNITHCKQVNNWIAIYKYFDL